MSDLDRQERDAHEARWLGWFFFLLGMGTAYGSVATQHGMHTRSSPMVSGILLTVGVVLLIVSSRRLASIKLKRSIQFVPKLPTVGCQ